MAFRKIVSSCLNILFNIVHNTRAPRPALVTFCEIVFVVPASLYNAMVRQVYIVIVVKNLMHAAHAFFSSFNF